jgi:sugar lactone lactonase YvrE
MQIKKSLSISLFIILFALVTAPQVFAVLMIDTVAGTGTAGYSGDGGPAIAASLYTPYGVAVDNSGNIYIADTFNHRVRKVNASGIITTVAGNGTAGYSGDGGAATAAKLNEPFRVAVDSSGNIYIADTYNYRVRKVNTSGIITTVAGNGTAGYSGDGGVATAANISYPVGITVDSSGNIYITDLDNYRVRKINTSGIITTVAGNGTAGYSGDGGAATAAKLNRSFGVTIDNSGNIYIADTYNYRIRKVNTSGIITTVAGNGTAGYSGDGGAATAAKLNYPREIGLDSSGNIYIADQGNNRVRKVNTSGIITTVAGNGTAGYSGDGGAATSASLRTPTGVAIDSTGNVFIADYGNNRIRKLYDVPVCAEGCGHGQCVSDNVCECDSGYTGSVCDQPVCSSPCAHGTCIAPDTCSCTSGYTGAVCDQPICEPACVNGNCTAPNTCECYIGYAGTTCNEPVCSNPCVHGNCTAPDTCECDEGYQGDTCEETPTIVTLSSFTATAKASRVILLWTTESEIDNAGFNIYRAESENGQYVKIITSLIPAKGAVTQGASYEIIDKDVKNRKTYYYKLEDIDLNGKSTFHEPVSATPRLIYGISKK